VFHELESHRLDGAFGDAGVIDEEPRQIEKPAPYVILPEPLARAMHMPSRKCSAEVAALKDAEIIGTMLFIAEYTRLQRTSA